MTLKVTVESAGKSVEDVVDLDIAVFNDFFQEKLGNAPIVRSEKAILKTYLAYKLGLVKK